MKPSFNQITVYNALSHLIHEQYYSKWDLVGDSGGSPGLENAVKRWNGPNELICFSVYFDARP